MSFVGIADPEILADIDAWTQALRTRIEGRARDLLELEPVQYGLQLLCYGRNAIL